MKPGVQQVRKRSHEHTQAEKGMPFSSSRFHAITGYP
jgi:hypothetical protein